MCLHVARGSSSRFHTRFGPCHDQVYMYKPDSKAPASSFFRSFKAPRFAKKRQPFAHPSLPFCSTTEWSQQRVEPHCSEQRALRCDVRRWVAQRVSGLQASQSGEICTDDVLLLRRRSHPVSEQMITQHPLRLYTRFCRPHLQTPPSLLIWRQSTRCFKPRTMHGHVSARACMLTCFSLCVPGMPGCVVGAR